MKKKTKQAGPAAWLRENKWTCAVLAAASLCGLADRQAEIVLDGGVLQDEWSEKTGHVLMTGPAAFGVDIRTGFIS